MSCTPKIMLAPTPRRGGKAPFRVHLVRHRNTGRAICGVKPAAGWQDAHGAVSCPCCLDRLPGNGRRPASHGVPREGIPRSW